MASSPKRKTLTQQATVGQQGINLIENLVLEMGCKWSPIGPIDTGIDGYIELFDPNTHGALGVQLAVQSKAVEREFVNETSSQLSFRCEQQDLSYWRSQNIPVILIVSRPSTSEAYWVRVNGKTLNPPAASLTVHFDKTKNRFSVESLRELLNEGAALDAGVSLGAELKREKLVSNLLPVATLPKKIFVAETTLRYPKQVWDAFAAAGTRGGDHWIMRGHQLVGFHDFSERPWRNVCDSGAVESFDVEEWSTSREADRVSDFRQLLHRAVSERLYGHNVKYRRDLDCFYFLPSSGPERKLSYRSVKRDSAVTVFKTFSQTTKDERIFIHHRHMAFQPRFREFGGTHYLEINPTYLFTSDGKQLYRFHADRLSGLKRIEGNRSVLSQVMLWADLLSRPPDLLTFSAPPLVEFAPLATFELGVGITDAAWKPSQESTTADDEVARFGTDSASEDEEFNFES